GRLGLGGNPSERRRRAPHAQRYPPRGDTQPTRTSQIQAGVTGTLGHYRAGAVRRHVRQQAAPGFVAADPPARRPAHRKYLPHAR
ncbi:hypothetical protein ABTK53_19670, partial [Acinetobacter baumannii]